MPVRLATLLRLPVLARTMPSAAAPKPPNTLWPGASVPEKPATGRPATAGRSAGGPAQAASRTTSARACGLTRSSGDSPLPSTRWDAVPGAELAQDRQ